MAVIAGCFGLKRNESERALARMLGALPDSSGLDTRRSHSAQSAALWRGRPGVGGFLGSKMTETGHNVAICVDGYISNLAQLAESLDCPGQSSDTVLLRAYQHWGIEFANHLAGSFSLAILDEQRKAVHLVRDLVGTKPLFWGARNGILVFASQPAAVALGQGLRVVLSKQAIRRELLGLDTIAPDSVFEGVRAVEPGCVQSAVDGNSRNHRYRALLALRRESLSDEELLGTMREGIAEGCSWYFGGQKDTVAVAFSGGLDSSAVLAACCQSPAQRERVLAVTAVPTGKAGADRGFAEQLVSQYGVSWDCFNSNAPTVPDELLAFAANPVRVSDLAFSSDVFRKAREHGCGVVLTGALGDVLGGAACGWQFDMLRSGQFGQLVGELRADGLGMLRLPRAVLGVAGRALLHRLKGRFPSLNRVGAERRAILDLIGATGRERLELSQECDDVERLFVAPSENYPDWVSRVVRQFCQVELSAFGLLARVHGLEAGFPLAHPKVLEASLSLPLRLRRQGGLTRVALREAAGSWLPPGVRQRREKLEFSDHMLPAWHRRVSEAREMGLVGKAAEFVDVNVWGDLSARGERLPSDVVYALYEVTILARWLELNAARQTGN